MGDLGEHQRYWRRLNGLTQAMVAERSGVSVSTVRGLESGESSSTDTLLRVMRVLGIMGTVVDAADPISVRVVLPGGDEVDVGTLRFTRARGRENTVFTYGQSYLVDARAYPIDPALPLQHGQFVPTERGLFGAMSDSATDRWGQGLLRRAERQLCRPPPLVARSD